MTSHSHFDNSSSRGSSPGPHPPSSPLSLIGNYSSGGPTSDAELEVDSNSQWEDPPSPREVASEPLRLGFSSEGQYADFSDDEEDTGSDQPAISLGVSPRGVIRSVGDTVDDQWDPALSTTHHVPAHPSERHCAPTPSRSAATPGRADQQPAVEDHQPPSKQANGETTTSSAPGPKTTPVAKKLSTMQTSSSFENWQGRAQLEILRNEYASEIQGRIARVDLDTFMREFVPGEDLPEGVVVDELDGDKFSSAEAPIYNELVGNLLPAYALFDTD